MLLPPTTIFCCAKNPVFAWDTLIRLAFFLSWIIRSSFSFHVYFALNRPSTPCWLRVKGLFNTADFLFFRIRINRCFEISFSHIELLLVARYSVESIVMTRSRSTASFSKRGSRRGGLLEKKILEICISDTVAAVSSQSVNFLPSILVRLKGLFNMTDFLFFCIRINRCFEISFCHIELLLAVR